MLRSNRYAQDSYTAKFSVNLILTQSCESLFVDQSLNPKPVVTETFEIGKDLTKEIVLQSNNLRFNPNCSLPVQSTFELVNADQSPIDGTVFSLTFDWTTSGMQSTINIAATDILKAGEYSMILIERSTSPTGLSFETILNVSLIDFCLSAELQLLQSVSVFTYTSGSGPTTLDLQAAKNAI